MVSLDRFIKRFNTQPPEGGCSVIVYSLNFGCGFQHTAARRRLLNGTDASRFLEILFQHTAARRRLLINGSTNPAFMAGFNTQPPEGGCALMSKVTTFVKEFQHTAARRRLLVTAGVYGDISSVSTHSRPKAAASDSVMFATCCCWVSTHSRPKAAALPSSSYATKSQCFNTQPPEGGCSTV